MPICFKCGKNLATDQSLQYHLQKRVKCNTLICPGCKKQFPNKLLFDNHKYECNTESSKELSRYDIFDQIQSNDIYIIELNKNYNIKYASKNYNYKNEDLIDKNINTIMNLDYVLNSNIKYIEVEHNKNKFNMTIKYNSDNILLVNTLCK